MLEYVKLRLTFRVLSDLVLPYYKGSTLRGLFKTSLKRICCPDSVSRCHECMLARECVYSIVTEHRTETGENTVLPYGISCSSLLSQFYGAGEMVSFDFVLLGRATAYIAYVIASLSNWDRLSPGRFQPLITEREILEYGEPYRWPDDIRPKGRLRLERVEQITNSGPKTLYSPGAPLSPPDAETLSIGALSQGASWQVKTDFVAPTRIFRKVQDQKTGKRKKRLIPPESFSFELLLRSVFTRYCELCKYFRDEPLDTNRLGLDDALEAAGSVTINENRMEMEKVRRYKRNNTRWEHYDGFLGEVVFENVPGSLIPWIMAGELFHVGKFPTLGYGEYRAEYRSS